MTRIPMTVEGAGLLQRELDSLKILRPKISQAIAEARAHGDLKENAEYHAAREQQGQTEARIRDIEYKLAHSSVIDISNIPEQGHIIFGITVYLMDTKQEKEVIYKIVGEDEANVNLGKISITSPLARALIGKKIGDVVEVATPSGAVEYEVIKVEHV